MRFLLFEHKVVGGAPEGSKTKAAKKGEGGGGEHKAQGTGLDFRHAPDLTVRP